MRYTVETNLFGNGASAVCDSETDEILEWFTCPAHAVMAQALADELNELEDTPWPDMLVEVGGEG